ncbi:MAG: polysulfide reductase NrfD [Bacteroidetes bacterium]|nr:polysulfide reductase NrfD [Bacteroidota bacterium]
METKKPMSKAVELKTNGSNAGNFKTNFEPFIRPLAGKGNGYTMVLGATVILVGIWLYYCIDMFIHGHALDGTTNYGAIWGITVAHVVQWIGVSHVGIAISATVRVLRLRHLRNIARLAELITIVSMIVAVTNIGLDTGKMGWFIINTVLYGRWHSPMVWSCTVITLYIFGTSSYLYLSMRRDFWLMSTIAPRWKGFYKALAWGYEDTEAERKRHEITCFWCALPLLPIMVSVHSVYGLFFGMLQSHPGWFNPLMAPYFVLGAIVTGFSFVILTMSILRGAYGWKEIFPDKNFQVLGVFLAFVIALYIYFLWSEMMVGNYAAPPLEKATAKSLLTGEFSGMFWFAVITGLFIPFFYFFRQGLKAKYINVPLSGVVAFLVFLALYLKRILVVVPAQFTFHIESLKEEAIPYSPTFSEQAVTYGTIFWGLLIFLILLKVLPIIEMPPEEDEPVPAGERKNSQRFRYLLVFLTVAGAITMIAWGFSTRQYDYAPVKWLIGILMLVCVPLANCLPKDKLIVKSNQ